MGIAKWDMTAPVSLQHAAQLPRVSASELLTDERDAVAVLVEREQRFDMSELVVEAAPAVPGGDAEIASRRVDDAQPPVHPWSFCVRATDAGLWRRGFVPILPTGHYLADAVRNIQVLRGAGVPLDDDEAISELPPARRERGTAVVLGTATAGNYFHWLFESVGRLGILKAALPAFLDDHPDTRYVVAPLSARQREVLTAAGVPAEQVFELEDELVVFDRLIVPSRGLGRIHCFSPAAAGFLRSLVPKRGRPTRRVYLSRQGARQRRIINEPELIAALERRGFEAVKAERLAFDEQLELFSETCVLVSAHGAGLANQVFMPPGGAVIEIQPPSPGNTPAVLYWSLASTVGHRYAIFVAATAPRTETSRTGANADVEINVEAFTGLVDRAVGRRLERPPRPSAISARIGADAEKPLVYDLGMNQGRNLPYYLAKGCRVVAVEAAPDLAKAARERFRDSIEAGDLVVLNVGVAAADGVGEFYVNSENTVQSSFIKPATWGPEWSIIEIPTRPVSKLIEEYGDPWFLKIDVEGYDGVVLRELMRAGVKPRSMSAEAHSIDVISALIAFGYDEFHLVNGRHIGNSIARLEITTVDGRKVPYLFPRHAAGPFGDDLPGPWLSAEAAMHQWLGRRAFFGRGWVDVHARDSVPAGDSGA